MNKEKFRWVDESIVLDFDMPAHVKNELLDLEKMDTEEDVCYLALASKLEDYLHEEVISGCLTYGQVIDIVNKYYGDKTYLWEKENGYLLF